MEQWVLLYNIILSLIKKLTHQPAVYAGEMAGAKAVRAPSETCSDPQWAVEAAGRNCSLSLLTKADGSVK